jgi:hypothetical protein
MASLLSFDAEKQSCLVLNLGSEIDKIIGMTKSKEATVPWALVFGDGVAFLLVTVLGFARHEALLAGAWERILATFVPFYFAWLATAPWLGVFNLVVAKNMRQIWRVPIAAIYAAPMGGLLRGLWLGSPVLPIFILVMAGVSAVLMLLWRAAYAQFHPGTAQVPTSTEWE